MCVHALHAKQIVVVSQCSDGSVWWCHSVVTGVCGGVSQCIDRSVWWCVTVY